MSAVTITLNFPNAAEAAAALNKLTAEQILGVLLHADRPDVGAAPAAVLNPFVPPAAFNPFAAAAEAAAPAPGAAVVPAAPTAPVAPVAPASALPPASAPVAPIAGVPPAGVDVDSAGLPWDGRIHGSTKTKNADGTWRQKRSIDESLKLRVETELRAAMSARAPGGVAVAAAPTAPVAPVPGAATPSAPPAVSAVTPPASVGANFSDLMIKVTPMFSDPVRCAVLNESLAAFNLTSVGGLASRADLWVPFETYLYQQLAAVPA